MKRLLFVSMLFFLGTVLAQGGQTSSIKPSSQTQILNNKEYYIHIVEQGQTLFSIARAYGLKYYDAVIKTDIHLMKVGDTVWLPKNEYSVAAVVAKASSVVSPSTRIHYIKVEPGQTLYSISKEYGVTVDQIIEANPELRSQQLQAGQMLKIPPRNTQAVTTGGTDETSSLRQTGTTQHTTEVPETPAKVPSAKAEPAVTPSKPSATPATPSATPASPAEPKVQHNTPSASVLPTSTADKSPSTQAVAPVDSALATTMRRPIQNPYPFNEVPESFPTQQAPYFNFSSASTFNYQVRDRQDKNKVFVTVIMPLNLDKINEISTSKFDIEQRGKKDYKVFEFIQFYEGILIALDQLQNRGLNVVLNVVDLSSDKEEDVEDAFSKYHLANSDFIVALLVKKPFDKLAQLAKQHQVFVINPFSSRPEVVENNPYIVKCMPSMEGTVKGILDMISKRHRGGQLYLVHSNSKSASTDEKVYREEFIRQLESRKDIKYTLFDWAVNGKLLSTLKSTKDNVIVSIYDQGKSKNTVYVTTLLNRLSSLNTDAPTLYSLSNFIDDYPDIDYSQLQHLNYSMVTVGHLNYDNQKHKEFIDTYKTKFLTEPNSLYAGVAHDIVIYFCSALWQQGPDFWRNPQNFVAPADMLFPFSLKQRSSTGGYENQLPDIYRMLNYKLVK